MDRNLNRISLLTRHAVLAFIFLFVSSCASTTIHNSPSGDESSASTISGIKYGKYCGGGRPSFESLPLTPERLSDLKSIWPPIDDIDLMCYAHDMCYELVGLRSGICDQALGKVSVRTHELFKEPGCDFLAQLLVHISGKFWAEEKDKGSQALMRAGTLIGTAMSIPLLTLQFMTEDDGLPEAEGRCFVGNDPELSTMLIISEFESGYRVFSKGFRFWTRGTPVLDSVSIEIPMDNWEEKYFVYELQRYLNYFGYSAGNADGILGEKTRNAIAQYQTENNLQNSQKSQAIILARLKEKYLERNWFTRMKESVVRKEKIHGE